MKKLYSILLLSMLCFFGKVNAQNNYYEADEQAGGCSVTFTYTTSGLTINVTATGVGAITPFYAWNFGDSGTGMGQTASHTYASSGTYTICVTYFDPNDSSCFAMDCDSVTLTSVGMPGNPSPLFELSGSPNPFTETALISVGVPTTQSNVSVEVYDMVGQKVETLYNDQLSAGTHRIEWSAEEFAAGVYFVRVQSGDAISVLRLVKQ